MIIYGYGISIERLKEADIELIRQKETIWIDDYKGKSLTDASMIKALAKHPILIERPIVIDGDKAIIGRELTKLKDFI